MPRTPAIDEPLPRRCLGGEARELRAVFVEGTSILVAGIEGRAFRAGPEERT
jgi:hypothetical protein